MRRTGGTSRLNWTSFGQACSSEAAAVESEGGRARDMTIFWLLIVRMSNISPESSLMKAASSRQIRRVRFIREWGPGAVRTGRLCNSTMDRSKRLAKADTAKPASAPSGSHDLLADDVVAHQDAERPRHVND